MLIDKTPSGELILINAAMFLEVMYMVFGVLCCLMLKFTAKMLTMDLGLLNGN